MQAELDFELLQIGDRVIELEGLASQRCGVVIGFQPYALSPDLIFPIICWDTGAISFSSSDLGLRKLEGVEQLCLLI